MKLNRKRVVTGLVATGLVAGVLAGGGAALAATGATPAPATSTSADPPYGYGMGAGHFGGMHGMWSGQQPGLAAAASYLGLTQTAAARPAAGGQVARRCRHRSGQDGVRPQGRDARRHHQPHQRRHRADSRSEGGDPRPGEGATSTRWST